MAAPRGRGEGTRSDLLEWVGDTVAQQLVGPEFAGGGPVDLVECGPLRPEPAQCPEPFIVCSLQDFEECEFLEEDLRSEELPRVEKRLELLTAGRKELSDESIGVSDGSGLVPARLLDNSVGLCEPRLRFEPGKQSSIPRTSGCAYRSQLASSPCKITEDVVEQSESSSFARARSKPSTKGVLSDAELLAALLGVRNGRV